MTKVEKQIRLAYRHHAIESLAPGYFACHCGCGYVGVCRHCVPDAPSHLPWKLCDEALALVQSGQVQCDGEGHIHAV